MHLLIALLRHEILGYPLYGWLALVALVALFAWAATSASDTCHLTRDGLDCG